MKLLALATAVLLAATPAAAQTTSPDHARIVAYVDGAVRTAMKTDHIAGASVAIVDRTGVVMTGGYGLAAPGR